MVRPKTMLRGTLFPNEHRRGADCDIFRRTRRTIMLKTPQEVIGVLRGVVKACFFFTHRLGGKSPIEIPMKVPGRFHVAYSAV